MKLKDVATIKHGFPYKGEYFTDVPTKNILLTPTNFTLKGGFQYANRYYSNEGEMPEEFILHKDDLIVTMTDLSKEIDTIGYGALIPDDPNHIFLHNQRIGLVTIFNPIVDKYYLYWLMRTKFYQRTIAGASNGATVHHTSPDRILSFNWIFPSLDNQKKIASILSAYDSQIENNKKRIKLLEQMAENLYREWFVRFRFPGYETAEFEGEVPKGWSSQASNNRKPKGWTYGELNQLGTFIRGKNITAAEMIEGQVPVISAGLEPAGYHNQANVCGPCLTISSSGANAGYLKYNLTDIWAADCSYYKNPDNIWFVYSSLKYLQPVISNLQCGAAQPHVYPKDVNRLCVILPPKSLITEYNRQSSLIFKDIHNLKNQIFLLTHQRDLLLPRLMSGKLSI